MRRSGQRSWAKRGPSGCEAGYQYGGKRRVEKGLGDSEVLFLYPRLAIQALDANGTMPHSLSAMPTDILEHIFQYFVLDDDDYEEYDPAHPGFMSGDTKSFARSLQLVGHAARCTLY